MQIKSRSNLTIMATIVIVGVLMATLSTTITSMPIAKAQSPPPGVSTGPPTFVGNPTRLSTGPPVPNCNAADQGNFHKLRN
jgi:hypothetical protein